MVITVFEIDFGHVSEELVFLSSSLETERVLKELHTTSHKDFLGLKSTR